MNAINKLKAQHIFLCRVVVLMFLFLTGFYGRSAAQYKITGFNCVVPGYYYGAYEITGGSWVAGDKWCVTGGTLNLTTNTCHTITTAPAVGVTWNAGVTTGSISFYKAGNATPVATMTVNIIQNTITYDVSTGLPFVSIGKVAQLRIIGTDSRTCNPDVIYSWSRSVDGVNWTTAGGNTKDLYISEAFTATTQFRRTVHHTVGSHTTANFSVIATPPLNAGTVSPNALTVKRNSSPGTTFTATAANGGSMCGGTYSYFWDTSPDKVNWTQAGTGLSYTFSGPVAARTYIRHRVVCGPLTDVGKIAVIDVYKKLHPGVIAPLSLTIASGSSPGLFHGSGAINGNNAVAYAYQWQRSTDGGITFSDISGATGQNFTPGALTVKTVFRRKVTCDGETSYTAPVVVNIATISASNQNFVKVREVLRSGVTTTLAADALTAVREIRQNTNYYDGLGRLSQQVTRQGALNTGSAATDLVSIRQYDGTGNSPVQLMPYASSATDGGFKLNPTSEQYNFNHTQFGATQNESHFYGLRQVESSPLHRVTAQLSPGENWAGKGRGKVFGFFTNTKEDDVRLWAVTNSSTTSTFGTYASQRSYLPGSLQKVISTLEDGKQIVEFQDESGQVVLKKVQMTAGADDGNGSGHSGWLCTYYIYDYLNNLRCVIPPRGVELISSNWKLTDPVILAEQCFRYEYDNKGRMTMKKTPGAGELYMVYDARSRMVMSQDAVQRIGNKWSVTLFDNLNRPVQSGLLLNSWNNKTFAQHLANGSMTTTYPFSASTVPSATYWEVLSMMGYDDYSTLPVASGLASTLDNTFTTGTYINTSYGTAPDFPVQPQQSAISRLKNLVTWTAVKVLGTTNFLYTVNIYDDKGRVIQSKHKNLTGGIDITTNQYNWIGQPLFIVEKTEKAGTPAQTMVTVTKMTYDDLGRLSKSEHKAANSLVNSGALPSAFKTLVVKEYDALGKLKKENIGQKPGGAVGAALANLNYQYNAQGFLISVNKDFITATSNADRYFAFELGFDKNANLGTFSPQYNGNIAGIIWKSEGDKEKRKYDFSYDHNNRLAGAVFTQYVSGSGAGAVFNTSAGIDYSVDNLTYDANGNILTMQQKGWRFGGSISVDNLSYNYMEGNKSNRLLNVIDQANNPQTTLGDFHTSALHPNSGAKSTTTVDYVYDANGNMVRDLNKDLITAGNTDGIKYNHLNLPYEVTFKKDLSNNKGTINYIYGANGIKLRKITVENNTAVLFNGTISIRMNCSWLRMERDVSDILPNMEVRRQDWNMTIFLKITSVT